MTKELFKGKSKEEVFDFIRERLKFKDNIESQLRYTDLEIFKREHRRFEMSGDEAYIEQNLAIVKEFADLGIFDYTDYLLIDFHKGCGKLSMRYINNKEELVFDLGGYETVEIIREIFEKTIFSDKPTNKHIY